MRNKYQVIVGNIGTVYDGNNKDEAEADYTKYVKDSCMEYGRASLEPVIMLKDDEPLFEYEGKFSSIKGQINE
tara:strand:- start:11 stop:229 length:219 start_codon:yes stop_codon:yes gene_type:complete